MSSGDCVRCIVPLMFAASPTKHNRQAMPRRNKKKKLNTIRLRRRGGYLADRWNDFKNWSKGPGKSLMDLGTETAGRFFPGSDYLLKGLRTILGTGAYNGKPGMELLASPVPDMHSAVDWGVRITHKEFLGDVNSSVLFALGSYALNPGIAATFPWLSQIAKCFQKYEFRGLAFVFKSTAATALNSTNTALGTIIGATQYSVYANDPNGKQQMLNLAGARDGKPSESNIYPVECSRKDSLTKNLLVRTGVVSDDMQKYDAGKFHLARIGSQAAAVVGELHVCYDIVLRQPAQPQAPAGHYWIADATDAKDATPFGTQVKVSGNLDITSTSTVLTIGAGPIAVYLLNVYWVGSVATITYPTITLANCAGVALLTGGSSSVVYSPPNGALNTPRAMFTYIIATTYSDVAATITLGAAGAIPASCEHCTVSLVSLDSGASTASSALNEQIQLANLIADAKSILTKHKVMSDIDFKEGWVVPKKT